jgi:hypothetical protein
MKSEHRERKMAKIRKTSSGQEQFMVSGHIWLYMMVLVLRMRPSLSSHIFASRLKRGKKKKKTGTTIFSFFSFMSSLYHLQGLGVPITVLATVKYPTSQQSESLSCAYLFSSHFLLAG